MLLLLADANFCFEYTLEAQTMRSNESSEDYLEAILVLSHCKPVVRSVDIADEMGFKKSSISVAMKNLREKVERLGDTDYFVLAGITPEYLEDETADMLKKALAAGVKVVVDTNTNIMRQVLPAKPFMVKMTDDDLALLVDRELKSKKQIVAAAKEIHEAGARHVLVLIGGSQAVLVYDEGVYEGEVMDHDKFVNTVGTGDSLVAGFLMDYLRTRDVLDSFKFAVSCGAATAYSRGLATRGKIDSFYKQAEIKKLD